MSQSSAQSRAVPASRRPSSAGCARAPSSLLARDRRCVLFVALATYQPGRSGLFASPATASRSATASGRSAPGIADVLFFLFGRPAFLFPVMLAVACWLLFRNRAAGRRRATRANAAVRIGGFVLRARRKLRARHAALGSRRAAADCRRRARAARGRRGSAAGLQLLGATLLLLAVWMAGAVARVPRLVARRHRSHRALGFWQARRLVARRSSRHAREVADGQERKRGAQGSRQAVEQKKAPRARRPIIETPAPRGREERARREGASGHAVRAAQGQRTAAAASCSTIRRRARRGLFGRSARGLVAPGRDQAEGFRRRGRSGRGASGPGGHALRDAAGAGRQGQPDLRSREGSGAGAVRDPRARGRGHSRQVGHGPRDPEREARDGHARRDHQVEGLRRRAFAARARARQGHRRSRRWSRISRACRTC